MELSECDEANDGMGNMCFYIAEVIASHKTVPYAGKCFLELGNETIDLELDQ